MKPKHILLAGLFFFLLPLTAHGRVVDTGYNSRIHREIFFCYDPSYGDTIYCYLSGTYNEDNPSSIYDLTVCEPPRRGDEPEFTYPSRYEGDIVIPDTIMVDGVYYTIRGIYDLNPGLSGITSLTIPKSMTSLNWLDDIYAPMDTTCAQIFVNKDNPKYSSYDGMLFSKNFDTVFYCPRGKKGHCTLPTRTKEIYLYAFHECHHLQSITGNAVTTMDWCALSSSHITALSMPAVQCVGAAALESTYLTSVFMPAVKVIYAYAFWNSYITSINIPDSTTYLDFAVFAKCPFLTCVQIGSNPNLDTIYLNAFDRDPKLKVLVLRNPIPPTVIGDLSSLGTTSPDSITLYVPCGCKERYSKSTWGVYFPHIQEQCEEGREVLVYPNPAKDYVYFSGSQDIKEVALYDLQGRVLQRQSFGTAAAVLNLCGLPPGLYVASLLLQDGSRIGKEITKR